MRLLLLVGLLGAVALAADSVVPPSTTRKEEPLHVNERLLEKWKADPHHKARLQRDLDAFWSLTPEQRKKMRQLDRELHHEDSATQQRLWGVLERYHVWLEKLDPEQRQWLATLPAKIREDLPLVGTKLDDQSIRLAAIRLLLDEQWVKQQPLPVQNEINALSVEKRPAEIARLREEQRQRHREAATVIPGGKQPKKEKMPAKLADYPKDVKTFVNDALWPLLNEAERAELRDAERQPWPASARKILQLADKHPIPLPGPTGPVRIADLQPGIQERLKRLPRIAQLEKAEGRWPEFGETLLNSPAFNRLASLPDRVTPKSAADMPEEVKAFIARELKSPEELQRLKDAEGKWPAYPREVLALAQKKKLTVPGMTLPALPELWDRAKTALPEVPAHVLAHFVMNELSNEERKRAAEAADDPMGREWVKKEYFRRHPDKLTEYQKLDVRPRRPKNPRARIDAP